MTLKDRIKQAAYDLGADLVGVGSIDRCAHAPLMMSPQGLFPGAQSVIVMGIHHPDACIELGGERHPQEIGPYSIQYLMNSRLDEMSYRLATVIEQSGFGAIPIVSSNIWRYNQYKDLKAVFAPDVSHIYMAVVAGLADLGFNGLALSPEYGARNRFITVITDAKLDPDPLIPPGTVCDGCMLCRKHCPAQALSKEIDGEKVVKIGEYEYRFPNKNLWRCSWGEHFDLDLDLEIPEVVTEAVVLENVAKHGIRSGEMGQCLKFCVPKAVRGFDRSYSKTPMRQHWATCDEAKLSRGVIDRFLTRTTAGGAEWLIVSSAEELRAAGFDLESVLPGAKCAVTVATTCPPMANTWDFHFGAQYQMDSLCYDLTRGIEELGFRSIMTIERSGSHPDAVPGARVTDAVVATVPELAAKIILGNTVVTRLALPAQRRLPAGPAVGIDRGDATAELTGSLAALAKELGADLVGVSSVARLDELAAQLRPVYAGESVLDAQDRSHRFTPWEPEISERQRTVKVPGDHLPGAQSVLVFGLRLHEESLRWATRPPAEAVGPYSYQTYVTNWLGAVIGARLVKRLEAFGYSAVLTTDLTGTESFTANPRGPQPDLFANRFAGLAAGLGYLTTSGHLATPQFGIRQRVVAIVTDAPLTASPLYTPATEAIRCTTCDEPCLTTCPSRAFTGERVEVSCEGQRYAFQRIDARRCDWVKRYALMGESGFQYLGSTLDLAPDDAITAAGLADALRQHDPIKKYRPVVAEPCVINCPLAVNEPRSSKVTSA
jgi:epoxyqueuosine reductase QueG